MKKLMLHIAITLFCQNVAFSQGCPPAPLGVAFSAQSTIDDFQTNYPGCTQIEGAVVISGPDITNLNGLSMVTSIAGRLQIAANKSLTDLSGLENLTFIGDYLEIYSNNALTSIQALNHLTHVGGPVYINFNNSLTSLDGLEKLTQVNGNLGIAYNPSLKSLNGLQNIRSIGGYLSIGSNNVLTSLAELGKVTSVSGDLAVYYNPSLTSLHGLDSIKSGSIYSLMITHNTSLSTCEVQSICSYLASPNGSVDIQGNASGCNSTEEVLAKCSAVSVGNQIVSEGFSVYPNPSSNLLIIKTPGRSVKSNLSILNLLGQVVINRQISAPITLIDINLLPDGVYMVQLNGDKTCETRKIIKR